MGTVPDLMDNQNSHTMRKRPRMPWEQLRGKPGLPASAWMEALRMLERREVTPRRNELLLVYELWMHIGAEERWLPFAEVAVRAAELDAVLDTWDEGERDTALLRAMRMRCKFIRGLGPRLGHPVLDVRTVTDWIVAGLALPLENVRLLAQAASDFLEAPKGPATVPAFDYDVEIGRLMQLRQMRHRLDVAQDLASAGHLPSGSAIQSWLAIRHLLP